MTELRALLHLIRTDRAARRAVLTGAVALLILFAWLAVQELR